MDKNKSKSVWTKTIRWPEGFLIVAIILYYANKNQWATDFVDEIIMWTVAIIAGILYFSIKKRIKFINNNTVKSIMVMVVLIVVSAFLIGGLTRIF